MPAGIAFMIKSYVYILNPLFVYQPHLQHLTHGDGALVTDLADVQQAVDAAWAGINVYKCPIHLDGRHHTSHNVAHLQLPHGNVFKNTAVSEHQACLILLRATRM